MCFLYEECREAHEEDVWFPVRFWADQDRERKEYVIHRYQNNGFSIVLDVNSGSVHVVDEVVYELVSVVERALAEDVSEAEKIVRLAVEATTYPEGVCREAVGEILELKEAGMLFSEDPYAAYADTLQKRETVVKAMCLHIAHDCNLACEYCFAEEGEYHGRRALMSFETGKAALDFLVKNSANRVNLEVDFFGGEPLLNWQVVKDLVAYGRSLEEPYHKKFRFTLTTNGILLDDEVQDFLNREMSNVVLSIDGRREVHDRMRPFRGGQGSYDRIIPRFVKLAESREQKNYYVRGTFTRYNLDFSKDVLHLADLGFEQISVEPVVAQDSEAYAIRQEDVPGILEEYDRLAVALLEREKAGKGVNFFHFMIDLEGGPCVAKRLSGCGSGCEYLAVTPWGDFYPCHQFVGQEQFLMGNVEEGITRTDIRDTFKSCHVYAKETCQDCFAKFYCSGGCAANSWNFHKTIFDAYGIGCELQRKRVECAIMMKAALAEAASPMKKEKTR
jgi:uncharacterized protein